LLSSSRISYVLGSFFAVALLVSVASACPRHHMMQKHAPATTSLKALPEKVSPQGATPQASGTPPESHALLQEPIDVKTDLNVNGKPDENATAIQQGKVLMESHCVTCHSLPRPSTHTMSEWPKVLQRMAPRSGLQEPEVKLIEQYLSSELNAPPADLKTDSKTESK
jgi:hypothetical protein